MTIRCSGSTPRLKVPHHTTLFYVPSKAPLDLITDYKGGVKLPCEARLQWMNPELAAVTPAIYPRHHDSEDLPLT
jgi:hypothetical protein